MGIVKQKFLNLDKYYHSIESKIRVNDFSLYDSDKSKECFKMLINTYESDVVSTIPRCMCGKMSGMFVKDRMCPSCGFRVAEKGYDPLVWVKTFSDEYKFINPIFYTMLNNVLKDTVAYLIGMEDEFKNEKAASLAKSIDSAILKGDRTYRNFIANLDNILDLVLTLPKHKESHGKIMLVKYLLDKYREDIFGYYLPLVSPMIFNITKTNKGKFVDIKLTNIIDIAANWLKASTVEMNDRQKNRLIGQTYTKLALLIKFYITDYLGTKTGFLRKHLNGAKVPMTFRTVIVSRHGKHWHDELEVPWVTGVSVFRPHVLNKLIKKYKWKYKDAIKLIYKGAKEYHPLLDQIFQELIEESPYRGIPCLIQRNPSLLQGSSQLVYITKFKTDPEDNTMGFSQLIVKAPNGDYDGDELNVIPLLDNKLTEIFRTLEPKYNIPGPTPFSVSSNLTILAPGHTIMMEYLQDDTNNEDCGIINKL